MLWARVFPWTAAHWPIGLHALLGVAPRFAGEGLPPPLGVAGGRPHVEGAWRRCEGRLGLGALPFPAACPWGGRLGVVVCGGRGVCVPLLVLGGAVCAVAAWLVLVYPFSRCTCAPLLPSAVCCRVVRAVVPWLVAVLPSRRASPALVPCSTGAVYRVILIRSPRRSGSVVPPPVTLWSTFCIWAGAQE